MAVWGYWQKKPTFENNMINLVGWAHHGSLATTEIKYKDTIDIYINLIMHPGIQSESAILDVDLNNDLNLFFSILVIKDRMRLVIKDGGKEQGFPLPNLSNIHITINRDTIKLYSDQLKIINYTYNDPIESCKISFGNNWSNNIDQIENKIAFSISNPQIIVDGVLLLFDPDKLKFLGKDNLNP